MNKLRINKAFTLIEVLVVVGIIALLAGVGIVAFSHAKTAARMHMTQTAIGMISAGAEMFKNDFNVFPPSNDHENSEATYANFTELGLPSTDMSTFNGDLNSGAKLICYFLTGYPSPTSSTVISGPYNSDGTLRINSIATNDGCTGFGFRIRQRGKIFGPYGGAEAAKTEYTVSSATTTNNSPKVFIDSWKHAILYYRCNYNSSSHTYSYEDGDNQSVTVLGDNSPTPYNVSGTSTKFNDFAAARKDFLIISPGEVDSSFEWSKAVTNVPAEK